MSMTITLPPAVQAALTRQAHAKGRPADEYAADILTRAFMPTPDAARPKQGTAEWLAEFNAWADSHEPVNHFVDDSRETLYGGPEGRGEWEC